MRGELRERVECSSRSERCESHRAPCFLIVLRVTNQSKCLPGHFSLYVTTRRWSCLAGEENRCTIYGISADSSSLCSELGRVQNTWSSSIRSRYTEVSWRSFRDARYLAGPQAYANAQTSRGGGKSPFQSEVQVSGPFRENEKRLGELGITPRELEILEAMAAGHSNREISEKLFVSGDTVRKRAPPGCSTTSRLKRRTQAVQRAKGGWSHPVKGWLARVKGLDVIELSGFAVESVNTRGCDHLSNSLARAAGLINENC